MTPGRAGSRGRRPIARTRRSDRGGGSLDPGRRASALWARSCSSTCASLISRRRRQPADNSLAPSARWDLSDRHRRHRRSKSGSLPPRPRSVRSTANPRRLLRNRDHAHREACAQAGARAAARRWLCRGRLHGLPNPAPQLMTDDSRASATAVAGGASRNGRRAGSASPQRRQVSSNPEMSASRISGGSCVGSDDVAASSHRRMATPGACRAARPARCVTAALLARSVTSRVRPAPRS